MQYILYAVIAVAAVFFIRSNGRIVRRSRESGHRFWMIDPRSLWVGLCSIDFAILLVAAGVLCGSVYMLFPQRFNEAWKKGAIVRIVIPVK